MKLFICLIFLISQNSFSQSEWKIAIDRTGFGSVEILLEIEKRIKKSYADAGKKVKILNIPLERSFKELSSGLLDAELGRSGEVISKLNINFINVLLVNINLCLYSLKKNPPPLEEAIVVYMRGSKQLDTLIVKKRIKLTNTEQALKFFNRRSDYIDYYIGIDIVTDDIMKKLKKPKLACFKIIKKSKVFHTIAKKNKAKIPILEKSFKKFFPIIPKTGTQKPLND